MAEMEDLGLNPNDHSEALDAMEKGQDFDATDGGEGDVGDVGGGGVHDPELQAIKARLREMEKEAEKLKQTQPEVDKQMNLGSPPGMITAGKTVIERRSSDSSATVPDQPSTRNLLSRVEDALQGKEPFYIEQDNRQCGLPDRLQLPRGNKAGLSLSMLVFISPYEGQESKGRKAIISCGAGIGYQEMDNRHMGFPFDRRIQDLYDFLVPNIYQTDVSVYHKNQKPS